MKRKYFLKSINLKSTNLKPMNLKSISFLILSILGLSAQAFNTSGNTSEITGAGSTFVYPAISAWAQSYKTISGVEINYQAIGSGAGIAQIKSKTVDFAATDKPLTQTELTSNQLSQFPLIMGAIVTAENIPSLSKNISNLLLSGEIISEIYLNQIHYWDDPKIKTLNPSFNLPHEAITPIYRADGSGTTYNFTKYLSAINPDFSKKIGSDTVVKFPTGIAAKGNAGIASYIKMIPGSIGYLEYSYAAQNHLSISNLLVQKTVTQPQTQAFNLAAHQAKNTEGIYQFPTNTPNAWPIMASTYILLPNQNKNLAESESFFKYAFEHPNQALNLNYVPLPNDLNQKIISSWK